MFFSEVGAGDKWNDIIYPGMKDAVVNTLIATQDVTETKKVPDCSGPAGTPNMSGSQSELY